MNEWIDVKQELPPLDAENCCMGEEDEGRFSEPVLVFDEDEGQVMAAGYDGKNREWSEFGGGCLLTGVTHWMPLPDPPKTAQS